MVNMGGSGIIKCGNNIWKKIYDTTSFKKVGLGSRENLRYNVHGCHNAMII